METLGNRIRMLRLYRNFSQKELGQGICSASAISQFESGKAKPSTQTLELLAKRLEFPVERIIYGNDYSRVEDLTALAINLMEQRHFGEATELFEQIIDNPVLTVMSIKPHVMLNLGQCYIEQQNYDVAIATLEKILTEKAPSNLFTDDVLFSDTHAALSRAYDLRGLNRAYKQVYGNNAHAVIASSEVRPQLHLVKS